MNEILPFVTMWMDLKGIVLSEVSRIEKDKYHMISFIFGILIKVVNEQIKPKKIKHRYREQNSDYQRERNVEGW